MSTGLIDIMKQASLNAIENRKPCDLRYGTVNSVSPLTIQITPQFILPESLLIVPEQLTDHEVKVTISGYNWTTDNKSGGSGDAMFSSHNHSLSQSEQTLKIHGGLKVGDKVALLRQSGGQFYFVLDRI